MKPKLQRLLAGAGALLVLAAVGSAYLTPDMVMDLATRVWSCF